jgi:hypothetical protein
VNIVQINPNPSKIQLIEKRETKTSRGILSKGWYQVDGDLVMVKGNSITEAGTAGLEPYSEVMAAKIAEILKIDHVDYTLMPAELFPEIKTYSCPVVSVCKNFLQPDAKLYHFADMADAYFLTGTEKQTADSTFRYAVSLYGKEWLYKMLAFDAFIGNEDRHENNFDVIVKKGQTYAPPLYDNGGSLLAWVPTDELVEAKLRYQYDRSKPFRAHHAQQIKLIDEPVFPAMDLDKVYADILETIAPTLALLEEKRANAIRGYLKNRLHYLKAAMG